MTHSTASLFAAKCAALVVLAASALALALPAAAAETECPDIPPPGEDVVPPRAIDGATYRVQGFQVPSPTPAARWFIVQCSAMGVVFAHKLASGLTVTEAAQAIALPLWDSDPTFLLAVRAKIAPAIPPGRLSMPLSITRVKETVLPCVDFQAAGDSDGTPFEVHGRLCYAHKEQTLGRLATVVMTSSMPGEDDRAQALAFLAAASPK